MSSFRWFLRLAGVLVALTVSPGEGRAENIFDFLFGGAPSAPPPAEAPRYRPRAPAAPVKARRAPVNASLRPVRPGEYDGASMGGAGFCVRSCDGYYFPAPKQSRAQRQQSCEYACPSAAVEFYAGSSIEDARNAKGERYARLPTAFSFRDKRAEQCSCNRPETSQAFFVRISRSDPTLRDGDVLMQPDGALVYHDKNFTPVDRARFVPAWERDKLRALLDQTRGRRQPPQNADATPTGITRIPKTEAKAAEKPPLVWVSPH